MEVELEVDEDNQIIEVENAPGTRGGSSMISTQTTGVSDLSRIISKVTAKTRKIEFSVIKGNVEEAEKKQDDTKAMTGTVKAAPEKQPKIEKKGTVIRSVKDGYEIERVLGRGGFGVVYKVKSKNTGEVYALKTEEKTTALVCQRLKCEGWIMFGMSNRQSRYFLDLIDCGQTSSYHFVVMPLIGRSLDVIKKSLLCDENFSPSTVVNLMITTFHAIEDMHNCGFLHRDIKPANFAVGLEDWSQIYILDFGISRHIRDYDGSVIRPRKVVPFIGTLRYAPRSCHACQEYGRVGDLESWLFMSLEMWNANFLPWTNEPDKDTYHMHKKSLLTTPYRFLMADPKMPTEFCHISMYIGSLNNLERPDYSAIRDLLMKIPETNKEVDLNQRYDWLEPKVMQRAKERETEAREKRKLEGLTDVSNATNYFVYGV